MKIRASLQHLSKQLYDNKYTISFEDVKASFHGHWTDRDENEMEIFRECACGADQQTLIEQVKYLL